MPLDGADFAPGSLQHILHSMNDTESSPGSGGAEPDTSGGLHHRPHHQQPPPAHDSVADVLQCAAADANSSGVTAARETPNPSHSTAPAHSHGIIAPPHITTGALPGIPFPQCANLLLRSCRILKRLFLVPFAL